jgi:hypothetical protein
MAEIEGMTKEQIEDRIEELEKHNFYLNMGSLSSKQEEIIDNNDREIKKLKEALTMLETVNELTIEEVKELNIKGYSLLIEDGTVKAITKEG